MVDHLNWLMKIGGLWRQGAAVSIIGNVVSGTTNPNIFGPLVNTIQYDPPPHDVVALRDSTTASAFTNFPLVVLP